MRIAVNLREWLPGGHIGGIEGYVRAVVGGLAARDHELTLFVGDAVVDESRARWPRAELRIVPVHATGLSIEPELNPDAHDVLLCPQLGLDPLEPGLPSVAMITDLAPRLLPDCFDVAYREHRERLVAATVRAATIVLTLSHYSRQTILDAYELNPGRVVVTHCDVGPEFRRPPTAPAMPEVPDEYVYFPANFWLNKNHSNLLAAFALLSRRRPSLALVLTGAPTTGAEPVLSQVQTLGLQDEVWMLGIQPSEVVVALMRGARALVFATLFEGFGIPPLEAFHVGTPVVASGAAGNAEVVGDAALIVDPTDPTSIAEGIERVLDDESLRAQLIERGRARTAAFSWQRTVEIVEAALRDAAERGVSRRSQVMIHEPLRVSLVTSVDNEARFLAETIDSVLAQEYPYVDYVVLDGGSRDGTTDVLHSYDGRIRWYSRPARGRADAINEGFTSTRGDLFAFLNTDDVYFPDTLWRAVAQFDAHPGTSVVYGRADTIDAHGTKLKNWVPAEFDHELLSQGCFIAQPAAVMTRDAFAGVGMLDDSLRSAFDYDLWIQISKNGGSFIRTTDRLAAARSHDSNETSTTYAIRCSEACAVVKRHYGYTPLSWALARARCAAPGDDPSTGSRSAATLARALAIGWRYNPRQLRRFTTEWAIALRQSRSP